MRAANTVVILAGTRDSQRRCAGDAAADGGSTECICDDAATLQMKPIVRQVQEAELGPTTTTVLSTVIAIALTAGCPLPPAHTVFFSNFLLVLPSSSTSSASLCVNTVTNTITISTGICCIRDHQRICECAHPLQNVLSVVLVLAAADGHPHDAAERVSG